MSKRSTLDVANISAKRAGIGDWCLKPNEFTSLSFPEALIRIGFALGVACGTAPAAYAVDGCTVMLCLASPKWSVVPQCVPPVRQLFHDLARGRSFPGCKTSNGGSGSGGTTVARNSWALAPGFCPAQYTHLLNVDPTPVYSCDYTGAISLVVNGAAFSRTWWRSSGESVTEFSPVAKSQLGTWDKQFDTDYAAWLASQAPADPTPSTGQ